MDGNRLVHIPPVAELFRPDEIQNFLRMLGIFADNQHKRLYDRFSVIFRIGSQMQFRTFMAFDTVQQHHLVQLFFAEIVAINVRPPDSIRRSCIAIRYRL